MMECRELAIRFARASMQSAIVLAYREDQDIFETCREFRGFDKETYTSWGRQLFHSLDAGRMPRLFNRLMRKTIGTFNAKLKSDSESGEKLIDTCEKIEKFVLLHRMPLANGQSIKYP